MIYLDNSATSFYKPMEVKNAVINSLSKYTANPGRGGYKESEETAKMIYETRKKLNGFFGGYGEENVVFTQSCTAALNQVIFGLLKKGDHCVISDMEHNAVIRPLNALRSRGVEVTKAETYPYDDDKTVESFRNAIKKNTKLLLVTAASNVWGIRLPLERLSALANIYGIKFCLDASQAAGIIEINMKENSIDYLCFPAHKSLYGIMGLGVLMMKDGDSLDPLIYGGTGINSLSENQPDSAPERYESGTLNVSAIAALNKGVDFVKSKTLKRIHHHETEILKMIYKDLKKLDKIKFYTDIPSEINSLPVLSFNAGVDSEKVGGFYKSNGIALRCGLHCAPDAHRKFGTENIGTIRISPSAFTNFNDAENFVKVSRKMIKIIN